MIRKHWTPSYIKNRIKEWIFSKKNPDTPWLTQYSIALLNQLIRGKDIGLEFGSGRSTMWFAKHCKYLTSVEDNLNWFNTVNRTLKENSINNVAYYHKQSNGTQPDKSDYFNIIHEFADNSLDFILIDGSIRDILALTAIEKLRCGGLLIIDNINRYIPHKTISPNSRSIEDGCINEIWADFQNKVLNWRCVWTSNGVWDTAIYIKT